MDYKVNGQIFSHTLRSLPNEAVIVVDKNVGGHDICLGETTTDRQGHYAITYSTSTLKKEHPDIQVQVLDKRDCSILATSPVRYNAQPEETDLDIIIPAEKRSEPPEYSLLLQELSPHLGNLREFDLKRRLSDQKEDDQQQDITYKHCAR